MMNMKNNQENISVESGFTLIEILVTLTILTLTMPALVRSFGQAQREQALAENKTTALYLLKYQMALIESEGFPEIGSDSGEFGEGSRYTWASEIADVESEEVEGLRSISLTVIWQEQGKEKSISVATLVSDRQLPQQNQDGQQQNQGGSPSTR
ncbi:MAG: prepilin-type N-terminal cleavage/methylation domain-containing protein [Candidatus Poribacteria bacterium]